MHTPHNARIAALPIAILVSLVTHAALAADLGDDPDDGIDFESELESDDLALMPTAVGVDEQDEPDAEPDQDGPEPPAAAVRKQRRKKDQ